MTAYLFVGLIAAVVAFVATPFVCRLATNIGAIDHPNDRKVHANPTPTLGGLAILLGIIVAGGVASFMPEFDRVFVQSAQPLGIGAAALVIFTLGVYDDFRPLTAAPKLAGQVFAAGLLFLAGVKMQYVLLPSSVLVLGDDLSVLVTIIWIVVMINAVNLIDGLDGLAAGIVAIAAASFFVYSYNLYEIDHLTLDIAAAPLLAIVVVGAALGFLRHNFHPARIFMGDSGSMLLGLVLGATTLVGVGKAPTNFSPDAANVLLAYSPLWIPALVVAIPILDAVLAVVRRVRGRRNVFHADKEHLHHRLMDLGHGHKQAVVVMYVWSALAAGAGLAFTFLDRSLWVYALPVAIAAIVLYTLFPMLTKVLQDRLDAS